MAKKRYLMDSEEFAAKYGPFQELTQAESMRLARAGYENRIFAVIGTEIPWADAPKKDRPSRKELLDMGYDDPYAYTWLQYDIALGFHIVNVEDRYLAARPIPEELDYRVDVYNMEDFGSVKYDGRLGSTFAGLMAAGSSDKKFVATFKLQGHLSRGDSSARKTSTRKFATVSEADAYLAGAAEGAGWMGYQDMQASADGLRLRVKWGAEDDSSPRYKMYSFSERARMLAFILGAKAAVGWDELVYSSVTAE